MAKCQQCNTSFKPKAEHQRFCSTRCRVAGHRAGQSKPARAGVTRNSAELDLAAEAARLAEWAAQLDAREQALAERQGERVNGKRALNALFKQATIDGPWYKQEPKRRGVERLRVRVSADLGGYTRREVEWLDDKGAYEAISQVEAIRRIEADGV